MSILGLGFDATDIPRVREVFERYGDRFLHRVFTDGEIAYCTRHRDPVPSLAARFAAKEALAKALGAGGGMAWTDAEVHTDDSGRPSLAVQGTVAVRAASLGVTRWHLSMSHDGGMAAATVIAEA